MLGWGWAEPAREQTQQQPRTVGTPVRGPPQERDLDLSLGLEPPWPGQEGLESRGCGSRAWEAVVWLLKGPVCSSGGSCPPQVGMASQRRDSLRPTRRSPFPSPALYAHTHPQVR